MTHDIINFYEKKHVHMIGIGGISMSGLAEILLHFGCTVTGSDTKESEITHKLEKKGVKIYYKHDGENVKGADLVVYTVAVHKDNPEIQAASSAGIPVVDRAILLGSIMRQYPRCICVSGTHGKTTVTSMISTVMLEAGKDPTVNLGGQLDIIGGNTRIGKGPFFIAEACEYYESFLKFCPFLAVITNIEEDHLDYYRDLEHIKSAFHTFAMLVPEDGFVIANGDDANTLSVLEGLKGKVVTYGIQSPDADWKAENIVFDKFGHPTFDVSYHGKVIGTLTLKISGVHNIYNALASSLSCFCVGVNMEDIQKGLSLFTGAHRRLEFKGVVENVEVYDDYAHHPTEIRATLSAVKNIKHNKLWCIFQPHTYSRTKALMADFSSSFIGAGQVIIPDIYAAREKDTGEVSSLELAEKINQVSGNAIYIPTFEAITEFLIKNVSPGDMILTMGAGDVYKVGEMYIKSKKMAAVS